jgi:serine/threonine-protein kinase RsbW
VVHLDLAVCLPQEAETVALIRRVLSDALATVGVTAACIDDVRLALSEACTNVIEHAAASDDYEVRLRVQGDWCEISVMNSGGGFDAAALAGVMPDESSPRGRGVAIMHAVMDHVSLRSEPQSGTIVHFVKNLDIVRGGPLDRLHRPPHEPAVDIG